MIHTIIFANYRYVNRLLYTICRCSCYLSQFRNSHREFQQFISYRYQTKSQKQILCNYDVLALHKKLKNVLYVLNTY